MVRIVKAIVYVIFCKILYRVKYTGKENIQNLDKCVICPNHSNWVDPIYLFAVTKNINIMAKAELFKNKLLGKIFLSFGIFPIHRGSKDAKSLIHAINKLNESTDSKLLVFPEGTRQRKEKPSSKAKIGAVYIALKADVPIIPVYITRWPKIFSKVNIKYGTPIYLDKSRTKDREYIEQMSNELLNVIYEMKD